MSYVGMGAACLLTLGMLVFICEKTETWSPIFEVGWLPPVLFLSWVALGWRYQVFYDEHQIVMKALGVRPVSIGFDQIAKIDKETSIARGRPFRRVVVYSIGSSGKFIDVSLKHFMIQDVRELVGDIKHHRPDLVTPEI